MGWGLMLWLCIAGVSARAEASAMPRVVIPFSGMVDLKAVKVELTIGFEGGRCVVLDVARPAAGHFDMKADVRHVGTSFGDVAAVVRGRFDLVGKDPLRRELAGEISTRYTLLNYKPVRDVYIKFAVRDKRLTVDPLWFGALSGHGQIGLVSPHEMDIALELLSADLDELWAMLRGHGMKTPPLSGIISGSLVLQGPWGKPVVNGHLAAYHGRLKNLAYDSIDLRFEGLYPLIRFQDGRVVSSDGPGFKVGGAVDLSDLGRLGTQFRQLKRELIVTDGDGGRTWAFRLNAADGHATRLKSFVTGDADGRSQGDAVIGLEKHIGF